MLLKYFACLALLLDSCAAQVQFTMDKAFFMGPYRNGQDDMNITWTGAKGTCTLWLMNGNPDDLNPVERMKGGLPQSRDHYVWTPETTLANGNYTFQIDDTGGPSNWSKWFLLNGGISATTSGSGPASTQTPTPSAPGSTVPSTPAPIPNASNTSSTKASHTKLPTATKVAIGVGAVLGTLIIGAVIFLPFWCGRCMAKNKQPSTSETPTSPATQQAMNSPTPPSYSPETSCAMIPDVETMKERRMADLSTRTNNAVSAAEGPFSDEEKKELQRRRRAAELEGNVYTAVPGMVSERTELEARRKGASWESGIISL